MPEARMVLNTSVENPVQTGARERDLIASVQGGQNELFYELVRPYERRGYAAALAVLRNQHDAEDGGQGRMLKAFAHIRPLWAEALGITVASVKTRLLRARLMLRDLLAAGWEQGWFSRLPFEKGTKPW